MALPTALTLFPCLQRFVVALSLIGCIGKEVRVHSADDEPASIRGSSTALHVRLPPLHACL